jgi:phosphohistidine phosphatase
MPIYVVRHARAVQGYPDELRELTDEGRETARRMGAHLERAGVRMARMYHSGLVRARQTAEALAEGLGFGLVSEAHDGLAPEDQPLPAAAWLEAEDSGDSGVMVVSHMPFVDRLVSLLVAGDPDAGLVDYKLCAVAKLVRRPTHGYQLAWLLTPKSAGAVRPS